MLEAPAIDPQDAVRPQDEPAASSTYWTVSGAARLLGCGAEDVRRAMLSLRMRFAMSVDEVGYLGGRDLIALAKSISKGCTCTCNAIMTWESEGGLPSGD